MVEALKLMNRVQFKRAVEPVEVLTYSLTYQGYPGQIKAEVKMLSDQEPIIQAVSVVEGEVFKDADLDVFDELRNAVQEHLSQQDLTNLITG